MKYIIIFLISILMFSSFDKKESYRDTCLSSKERALLLLQEMTLEEKVAQTVCVWQSDSSQLLDEDGEWSSVKTSENYPYGIGQIGRPSKLTRKRGAQEMAEYTNEIQRYFVEKTRLGIPVIFHEESLHGHAALEGTSFPQPIGLGSTFDADLVQHLYAMAAREIRSRGAHLALTPVVDVAREPRWGRVEETFGEDPYLVSEMGVAAVKGFQGDASFQNKENIMSTLKHFAAHGQPESGTNCGPVNVSESVLREVFFPPFKRCIQEAGAMNVMASYNEIDGVPSHANQWLLQDVLRKEWGYKGVVVSDYFAITELFQKKEDWGNWVASNRSEAAKLAITAGVNMELPTPDCYPFLVELVRKGEVKEEQIDVMVLPLLEQKFAMGLFEDPYVDPAKAQQIVNDPNHRKLALEAALKTIVLLENKNNTLPLNAGGISTLALIGPNADRPLLGGYSGWPKHDVTLREGIQKYLGADTKVVYAEGCKITTTSGRDAGGNKLFCADTWAADSVGLPSKEQDDALIQQAMQVAKQAQVVVLALGGNEQTSREAWEYNHMGDRTDLNLFGRQQELFDSLKTLGMPIVVVLNNGRPLTVNALSEQADALIECWYLGQESGTAIAQVLFGAFNPGGKLPISFPRSVGHIPAYYNHKPFDRRGYFNTQVTPLYPFGYGLSYTQFQLSAPLLSSSTINRGDSVTVSVQLTNIGDRAGDEVVQLYIRDIVSSVTRPVKELKRFRRIHLDAGAQSTLEFTLQPADFAFYNIQKEFVVEPGQFSIMLGNSSDKLNSVILKIQ